MKTATRDSDPMNSLRFLSFPLFLPLLATAAPAQTPFEEEGRASISLQGNTAFAARLDVDGDVAVLGGTLSGTPGRAVVFERASGSWSEVTLLDPSMPGSTTAPTDTVAVSGDTIATSQSSRNAVDLFLRLNGAWTFVQRLNAPTPGGFGHALALDGDTLVVGAPDTPSMMEGQVGTGYVYRNLAGTWALEQILLPATADESDSTGVSVALDGETLILGAVEYGAFGPSVGSAYVYTRTGSTWTLQERLRASDGAVLNGFGGRVALEGDRAAVVDDLGTAYLFERSGSTWSELQKLGLPGGASLSFTADVVIDGGLVALSDPEAMSFAGAAYLFEDTGSSWGLTQTLTPANPVSEYLSFGAAMDLSDGKLLGWAGAGTNPASEQTLITYSSELGEYPLSCFGDTTGSLPGCATCPCSNSPAPGTRGGCLNSVGQAGRLSAVGTASLAADTLELRLRDAAPDTFALLFAGSDLLPQGNASCPPGSGVVSAPVIDGFRCVGSGASIVRLGVRSTDANGDGNSPWGGGAPAAGLLALGGFTSGQTRHFQSFYRDDVVNGCGSGQNTTNAVTVMVAP